MTLFTLTETLAPKFAVNTLVEDTNKTIIIFRYPKEKVGKLSILEPEIIKIIVPLVLFIILGPKSSYGED